MGMRRCNREEGSVSPENATRSLQGSRFWSSCVPERNKKLAPKVPVHGGGANRGSPPQESGIAGASVVSVHVLGHHGCVFVRPAECVDEWKGGSGRGVGSRGGQGEWNCIPPGSQPTQSRIGGHLQAARIQERARPHRHRQDLRPLLTTPDLSPAQRPTAQRAPPWEGHGRGRVRDASLSSNSIVWYASGRPAAASDQEGHQPTPGVTGHARAAPAPPPRHCPVTPEAQGREQVRLTGGRAGPHWPGSIRTTTLWRLEKGCPFGLPLFGDQERPLRDRALGTFYGAQADKSGVRARNVRGCPCGLLGRPERGCPFGLLLFGSPGITIPLPHPRKPNLRPPQWPCQPQAVPTGAECGTQCWPSQKSGEVRTTIYPNGRVTGQWRGRGAGMAGVARAIGIVWAWVARACDPRGVSVGVLPDMPAPCPRHSCPIVAQSLRHARATPTPRPRQCPVSKRTTKYIGYALRNDL
eukprot:gene15815-biopygen6706